MEKVLSAEAARVLGVLIEKELSTPDYYPMTLNSLVNGCNQKSNRFPVVEYGEFEVRDYLDELQRYRLVGHASVAGSRSEKFRHATAQQFGLEVPELALLASLLLRGPQTVGELRTHATRMAAFDSIDEVSTRLDGLMAREEPLVMSLGRMPGQKGERFAHLLCGEVAMDDVAAAGMLVQPTARSSIAEELDEIRERLASLEEAFEQFKKQFE